MDTGGFCTNVLSARHSRQTFRHSPPPSESTPQDKIYYGRMMGFCLFRPLRRLIAARSSPRHRRGGPAVRASLLLLLALPCRAGAQHPTDTLAVDGSYDIEEIIVTARRATGLIPTQKLEGKALEELNNRVDALRYFSGIQIKDYGGIGGLKTVNIRSMGSQHVGVFFDGIQIGNAQNGTVDLGRFSLDNMEAISVYNGQKSSIFQSAKDFASASALYMETRRPRFRFHPHRQFQGDALKGGSFKAVNPSLLWEHKFGRRIHEELRSTRNTCTPPKDAGSVTRKPTDTTPRKSGRAATT